MEPDPVGMDPTVRDRCWAVVVTVVTTSGLGRLTVDGVLARAGLEDEQRATARRVLNAAAELGVLTHESNSTYWYRPDDLTDDLRETAEELEEREARLTALAARLG